MEYIEASNKYGNYYIPVSSKRNPCSRTIISGRVWEQDTITFILENYCGFPIVHAGTYFGDFLPALKPIPKVYAFEPNPENYEFAKMNVKLNNLTNVSLMFGGLSDASGQLDFLTKKANGESAGGQSKFSTNKKSIKVPVVCIDDIIKEKISILQLDVEGFELYALKGAIETISKFKPILILENAPVKSQWYVEHIIGLGYKNIHKCDVNTVWKV